MKKTFIEDLQVVIFDVDGTLYLQSKLRKIMFLKIIQYYLIKPWRYKELLIIYHFRKEREKRAGFSGVELKEAQYIWCAEKVGCEVNKVKAVVDKWIFNAPNTYLLSCMYPGVATFIEDLRNCGIKTAVYSDYDSKQKLKHMQINIDLQVCSTDSNINSFKPLPNGLLVILSKMNISVKEHCLFIGDRYELDGLCAESAGIPFLLVDKKLARKDFYLKLSDELRLNKQTC